MDQLEKEITKLVSDVTEIEEEKIWEKKDANFFKDLEVDSLLALEILASIEKKYKISIPEERLVDITSLTATISLTKEFLAQAGAQ